MPGTKPSVKKFKVQINHVTFEGGLVFLNVWGVCVCVCVCVQSLSRVRLFETLRTVARQAPLSMGSLGKNTGEGCHFLLQDIFPT